MSTSIENIANGQKPANPVAKFSSFLERFKPQMALALPKHLNVDRLARLAVTEFSKSPKLQECTGTSIVGCVLTAAQLGLEIGVNGQAYMVPYGKTATFVPGWKGLIDLVNRAGRASAWTGAAFEGDTFEYALGDRPFIKHRPSDEEQDERRLLYVYAVGRVRGSDWPIIEVWPMAKVWKHRDRYNKVGRQHYSYEHPEMYGRKIALLQVLKYLPQSVELARAVEYAHAAESGEGMTIDGDFAATVFDDPDPETGEIRPKAPPHVTDATPREPGPKPRSYAQLVELCDKATSEDAALLMLDEARDYLPEDQQADLLAFIKGKAWGKGKK